MVLMVKRKIGRIELEPGALPEAHELRTGERLARHGHDILFLKPANREGVTTPDIKMCGIKWEVKSPRGRGRWLIENTFQAAVKQSPNVILDLARIKIIQEKCLREAEKQFRHSKGMKKLIVITKSKKILDFHK